MDETAVYCKRIRKILESDPEGLESLLRRRWAGDSGPALGDDRTWNAILAYAYGETPDELKSHWPRALITVFDGFITGELLDLGVARRVELLGALDFARAITWPARLEGRLRAHLAGWLELALQPGFPAPRDLWEEDEIFGQPEPDVVAAMLRLACRELSWREAAERHWQQVLESEAGLDPKIVAWRLWEIARWAIAADRMEWLAERLIGFESALEEAEYAPGSLSRLFFLTEVDLGVDAAKQLLVTLPNGLKRVVPIDYPVRKALLELGLALAGDGGEVAEIHNRLLELQASIEVPATWDYDDLEPVVERLPQPAQALLRSWIAAVKHQEGMPPEEAFAAYQAASA